MDVERDAESATEVLGWHFAAAKPLTMTPDRERMVREWSIGFREAPDEMPERAVSWIIAELDATRARVAALEAVNADLGVALEKESDRLAEVERELSALTASHAACVRALARLVIAVDESQGDIEAPYRYRCRWPECDEARAALCSALAREVSDGS